MKLKEILNTFRKVGEDSYYWNEDINGPRYTLEEILEMNLEIFSSPIQKLVVLSIYPSDSGKNLCVDVEEI